MHARHDPPERRGGLPAVALVALLCLIAFGSLVEADDGDRAGRRLIDVLRELSQRGVELIFSSAVVDGSLRVTVEPEATDPRAILDAILPPLGLRAETGPAGAILILPARAGAGTVRGRVVAAAGGEPVPDARIRIAATGQTARSARDGSFEIPGVPEGRHDVRVAAPGFSPRAVEGVTVTPGAAAVVDIELPAWPTFVTEVIVTPGRHSVVRAEQAASRGLSGDEALLAPTLGDDITRVIELLPGVAAADNSAAFNVRGSEAQDVSLVLDGLELYDPFHLQSFQSPFSLIDSNVVDRVDFFGGGFTADLGDRHGGFIDISTLVPERQGRGEIEIGTLNSRVSYRAPAAGGAGSWLVSARGWYPDAVLRTTELGGGENLKPGFADVYAKGAFHAGPRHVVSAHALASFDRVKFDEVGEDVNESVDALTRNGYVWLRLIGVASERLSTETVLSGGRIERSRRGISSVDGPLIVDDEREVDFVGLKHDASWQVADAHVLKAGTEIRRLEAEYRYSTVPEDPADAVSIRIRPDGTSMGLYVAHRARITPSLATELGARWDRQTYTDDNQLSPRFNAVWRPGSRSELRLALGRFNQSQRIHELQIEDGETHFGRAESAEQAELSVQHRLPAGLRVRLDLYYRTLTDLRPRYENLFEPIELFPETIEDRVRVAPREARLRGAELLLRGRSDRPLFWWAGYTLSAAEDAIDGRHVPRSWDQTHALKGLLGYHREGRWSVSVGASAHTGWPTTPVEPRVVVLPDGSTEIEAVPGERNSDRFRDYLRVDLKARRAVTVARGKLWLTLEVANLTDRRNACCLDEVDFEERPDGSIVTRRRFDHWLRITPSFSVLWEF